MLKNKSLSIILTLTLLFTTGFSPATPNTVEKANVVNDKQSIKVNVNKCNITLETGSSDTFEFTYWGTASNSIYSVISTLEENVQKITATYTGDDTAPANNEGGIIIKIPDKEFQSLHIAGKYSGITLDNINMDVDLKTRGATVVMLDNSPGHISIDSTYDSYQIMLNPITNDFYLKEKGSLIEFQFSQEPSNLHFNIMEENEAKSQFPKGWSTDYTIGTGNPELKIENNKGIFRLSF